MTAAELIAALSKLDPSTEIIIQKDGEGNGYSPLHEVYTGVYQKRNDWSGEVGYGREDMTPELRATLATEYGCAPATIEAMIVDGPRVLVLAPRA